MPKLIDFFIKLFPEGVHAELDWHAQACEYRDTAQTAYTRFLVDIELSPLNNFFDLLIFIERLKRIMKLVEESSDSFARIGFIELDIEGHKRMEADIDAMLELRAKIQQLHENLEKKRDMLSQS